MSSPILNYDLSTWQLIVLLVVKIKVAVRIPGSTNTYEEFDFVDDTGASMSVLFYEDMHYLQELVRINTHYRPPVQIMGIASLSLADGQQVFPEIVVLEVNVFDQNGREMLPYWEPIQMVLHSRYNPTGRTNSRPSGPWLRTKLYTGTSPTGRKELLCADTKSALTRELPFAPLDPAQRHPLQPAPMTPVVPGPKFII
jgi:hypothetical protein